LRFQRKMRKLLAVLILMVGGGCSFSAIADELDTGHAQEVEALTEETSESADLNILNQSLQKSSNIVAHALTLMGIKYKWGGNSPSSGFDCSGFVRFVVGNSINMTLPRTAMAMSQVGRKIDLKDLLPGDLVFFKSKRGLFAHVGIYLGDKKFIHAPESGRTIGIDEIEANTYERRLSGARRLID